jgi:hypothetical protein
LFAAIYFHIYFCANRLFLFLAKIKHMSKFKLTIVCVFALFVGISACKKDNNTSNNNNNNNNNNPLNQQFGGGPPVPSSAAGALYAINTIADDNLYGDGHSEAGLPMGWFGSAAYTKYAGQVTCNSTSMTDSVMGYPMVWYMLDALNSGGYIDFSGSNNVVWNVAGNSASGITGFTHTDNTAWPTISGFNLATSTYRNANLTINFTSSSTVEGFVFSLFPYATQSVSVVKTAGANATSVTFTPADLAKAGHSGDAIVVQIMPYTYSTSTIGGKTYYFVKQTAYNQNTVLQ